ncbi:Cpe/LpqF family protein [Nonomuraea sp. NPDC059194]|uniref:Cpe/LpqF family protein n=1 Tax=Nonomuraea sp. NPDC059194 TaxID=3346764 RepID=UPI0036B01499
MRPVAIAVTTSSLLLTAYGVTVTSPGAAASAAAPAAGTAAVRDVPIPDTPAGRQLRWFMAAVPDAPLPEEQLTEHFTAAMLAAVPPAQLNAQLVAMKDLTLVKILHAEPTVIMSEVTTGGRTFWMELVVDRDGKIGGLRLTTPVTPKPTPASWKELDERIRKAAPRIGFMAAEITPRGDCRPVRSLAPRTARPLGSMYKLYVLRAAAEKIPDWNTKLTIRPELKSLPAGQLQDRPDNSKVSVMEAAKLMIAISDNTAADLLLHKVGRKAVEATQSRNVPLLTTRELFALKGADYPTHAKKYLSLGKKKQRAYLDKVIAKVPLGSIKAWSAPRELDTIEWFGSPADVCAAHAELRGLKDRRVEEVMTQTDAGLGLDRKTWRSVWFKGGSEQGVLDLGFSARTKDGRTFFVTAMASDTKAPLDEGNVASELIALTKGAFTLMQKG